MQSPILKTQDVSDEPGKENHTSARRLIVLVPPDKFDMQALSVCVRAISKAGQAVLYLALASDPEGDYTMNHRLKYLAGLVPGQPVKSGYKLAYYDNWPEAIQSVWVDGDRIVCLDGHMVRSPWFMQQLIARQLAAKHAFSIDIIHGLDLQKPVFWDAFWRGVFEWALAIGIIGLFFFIQVYISQNTPDILGKIFIILSILVEFWLIARFASG